MECAEFPRGSPLFSVEPSNREESTKHQHPSSREVSISKLRKTPVFSALKPSFGSAMSGVEHRVESWCLDVLWSLVLGIWCFNLEWLHRIQRRTERCSRSAATVLFGTHHRHVQRQLYHERLVWADEKIFYAIGRFSFFHTSGVARLGFDLEQNCFAAGNDD